MLMFAAQIFFDLTELTSFMKHDNKIKATGEIFQK